LADCEIELDFEDQYQDSFSCSKLFPTPID
jgi:hypothetical protein